MRIIKIIFVFGIMLMGLFELIRIIFWMLNHVKSITSLPSFDFIGIICISITLLIGFFNGIDKSAKSIADWVFE